MMINLLLIPIVIAVVIFGLCAMYPSLQDISDDKCEQKYGAELNQIKQENEAFRNRKITIHFKLIGGGNYDTRNED